jgi:hypothetical protein
METLNESRILPDALQMIDSTVIRAHHPLPGRAIRQHCPEREAAGAKGGLHDRVLGVRAPQSGKRSTGAFSDPPSTSRPISTPRQWCRPAHEVGHHAGANIGLSGLRSGHGRQPAGTLRPSRGPGQWLWQPSQDHGSAQCCAGNPDAKTPRNCAWQLPDKPHPEMGSSSRRHGTARR